MKIVLLERIVSGGQTGVDRAALDVAIDLGIPHGGWIPAGRRTENGPLPEKYDLIETETTRYPERTMRNVRDSDATLIVTQGPATGGTALTIDFTEKLGKSSLVFDLAEESEPPVIADWLSDQRVSILNVAGPRESTTPGIYDLTFTLLHRVLRAG